MKLNLMKSLTKTYYSGKLTLKEHSPELWVIGGVIGVVTASVLACKATLKVNDELAETKENIEKMKEAKANECTAVGKPYSEDDYKNDMRINYIQGGVKLAKLYAIPVGVGVVSIGAILYGHNILRKRNIALAASYATLFNDFKGYRSRVAERYGKAAEQAVMYNLKTKEVEEKVVDENGNETTVTKTLQEINADMDPSQYSPFARFFDDSCEGWDPNPEYSLAFLNKQQAVATDMLKSRGYLYVNEVYELLGIKPCIEGQTHGWIYDEENPIGDNYVDFGIYRLHVEKNRDFVNGYEQVILLDFNQDGYIMKHLKDYNIM